MNPSTEYEYEYESYVPQEPFDPQSLLRWIPVVLPYVLFLVGAIIVRSSQTIALRIISTSSIDSNRREMRSWNPADLPEESMNWKIIGGGVIVFGAALLSRRPVTTARNLEMNSIKSA